MIGAWMLFLLGASVGGVGVWLWLIVATDRVGRSQTRTHVWTVESIRLRIEQERRTDGTVRWEPFQMSEAASRAHRVPDVPARPNCMSGIALTERSSPLR